MTQTFSTKSHTASIRCVASNGRFVASGGADDRIAIYDFKDRKFVTDLYVHDGTVNSLAFTPDGSHLLTCGADGKINVIKSNNWKLEKCFQKAHKGSAVNHISIHPSGKLALSIGSDCTVRTWNLIKGRQAFATNLKNKSLGNIINFVEFSTSGDQFAVCGEKTVEVWDLAQANVVATKTVKTRISAIAWVSDKDLLIGMEDGKLLAYNYQESDDDEDGETLTCDIYKTRIKAMKYRDGFLTTAASDGKVSVWKTITVNDKLEIELASEFNIGCRPIALELLISASHVDVKSEDDEVEVKSTAARVLKTDQKVIVECSSASEDEEEPESPPRLQLKRKNQNQQQKKNSNQKKKLKK